MISNVSDEQLKEVYRHVPAAISGQVIVALLFVYELAGNTPPETLVLWSVSFFSILAYRIFNYIAFRKYLSETLTHDINTGKWVLLNALGVAATGIAWGISAIFIMHNNLLEYHFIPLAISMALSGIAVVTLGAVFFIYLSFTVPMISIISATLFLEQSATHSSAGFSAVMAMFYLVYTAYNHSKKTQQIEKQNQEIQSTQLEIVRRLSMASDSRDSDTGQHILRMSNSSYLLALKCGLPKEEAKIILNASPMHDIGKIAIPDNILLKPGKLDDEEWRVMQSHTTAGKDILKGHDSSIMTTATKIAESHHEKWDGTGYPNGLKGEEIPVCARIVAICDVFDALTSERPYKSAWSIEKATDYIRNQAGKHFDPVLVQCFLKILPQITEYSHNCSIDDCPSCFRLPSTTQKDFAL